MKKLLYIFAILSILLIPNTIKALTYTEKSADITISFDSKWYVFTRENIKNNNKLKELNIQHKDIHKSLYNNKTYIVAYYNNLELYVKNTKINDTINDLTNYNDNIVNELGIELYKKIGFTDYEIYKNNYKFIRSNYYDNNSNKYIIEYYTIINSKLYAITIQKEETFTEEEIITIKKIIDSIKFDINNYNEYEFISTTTEKAMIPKILICCLFGGCIGDIIGITADSINKIIKKKKY